MMSLFSAAHGSNIGRCPEGNVMWDKCFGTYEHPEIKVSGEWLNGRLNGYAVIKANGYAYLGDIKDAKFHGYGVLYNRASRCSGQFLDDKINGQGVCYWDDGRKYIGEFKNGEFHGRGLFYRQDGSIAQGIYEDGKLVKEAKVDILSFEKISDSNWGSARVRIEKFLVNFIKPGMTKDEIMFGLDMFWVDQEIRFDYLVEEYAGVKLDGFGSLFGSSDCGKPTVYPFRLTFNNKSLTSRFDYGKKFDVMYFDDARKFLKFVSLEDYINEKKLCRDASVEFQKNLANARAVESQKKWTEKRKKILEDLKPFASRPKPNINLDATCSEMGGNCSIDVISLSDDPFGVFRIVLNNKIGVEGCDEKFLSYLTTGDSVSKSRGDNCGGNIVKIEIFTDRGSIVKRGSWRDWK